MLFIFLPQFSCLNKFLNESIPTMKRGVEK